MEAIYKRYDGKKYVIYDEGNQLVVSVLGASRSVQWGVLCRDYHSCAVSYRKEDVIYVAYLNVDNTLYFDRLFQEGRLALVSGELLGNISNVQIEELQGEKSDIYVLYQHLDQETGTHAICAINPLGERKNQVIMTSKERIEHYRVVVHNGVSYLEYKLLSEPKSKIYAIDRNRLGDISLTEYILCKEKTIEELSRRCKEGDREFQRALREKQKEYETKLRDTTKEMEREYKEQYNELSKLAKGMQEEGRKWRELYYKSVTKN